MLNTMKTTAQRYDVMENTAHGTRSMDFRSGDPSADSRQLEENAAAQPLWRNKAWDRPGAANEILKEHFDVYW